ncbi:MAG: molybdopterin adenylyltransferase, partial [Thiotrichales bacterium 24-47-4]
MQTAKIGFVTISDRASQGIYEDKGGPAMQQWISDNLASPWQAVVRLIPDEQLVIEQTLIE